MTYSMKCVLERLRQSDVNGFPFTALTGVHPTTIRTLSERDYLFVSHGLDGVRYKITGRGLKALKVFEKATRRRDGLCPSCGVEPKHVYRSGNTAGYCKSCDSAYSKSQRKLGRPHINPDRMCSNCHQRPLHRFSGGGYCTYCTECRKSKRAAERKLRHERLIARIEAGEPPICIRKGCSEPRYRCGKYVYDYCREHYYAYMRSYNDRRRSESKAAKNRLSAGR